MGIVQLSLSLCIFHNCINYTRYFPIDNVKQRMKHLYDKSEEHRTDVRMLMMLVYVPPSDIPVRRG
jgi:hypothetical protein